MNRVRLPYVYLVIIIIMACATANLKTGFSCPSCIHADPDVAGRCLVLVRASLRARRRRGGGAHAEIFVAFYHSHVS